MKTQTTHTLRALNGVYNQTAANFALSVAARQFSFLLSSKGFKEQPVASDTNGAPKSNESPLFDVSAAAVASDSTMPEFSFLTKAAQAFDVDAACTAYACCLLLAQEFIPRVMEYGKPPSAESIGRYFSTPTDWLREKIAYMAPRITRTATANAATYGVAADVIAKAAAAQVDEYKVRTAMRASFLARSIASAVKSVTPLSTEDLVTELGQCSIKCGVTLDVEAKGAAEATLRARKAQVEQIAATPAGQVRPKMPSMPQPGLLKFWSDLGLAVA